MAAASAVFGLSRKLLTYFCTLTPLRSFALRISILFKKRIKSTCLELRPVSSCGDRKLTLARSLFAQTDFHSKRLSSCNDVEHISFENSTFGLTSRLTERSSASFWSKALNGAKNITALASSKYGIHWFLCVLD